MSKLHILQHTLGVGNYGDKDSYRNYFVTGVGTDDFPICEALVADGLMKRHDPRDIYGGNYCYTVTPAGIEYVATNSPKRPPEPKLTRAQRNYRNFLNADCGLSFAEYMGFQRRARS